MDSPKKMNDYYHIPRASLASSSAASSASSSNRSNKSFSNPPTVAQRALKKSQQQHYVNNLNTTNYGQQERAAELVGVNMTKTTMVTHGNRNNSREQTRAVGHTKHMSNARRDSELSVTSAATTAAAAAAVLAAAVKRGSRSSQGSNESNNSTRSAASGSLLLTAANLERFAEIHKKEQQHRQKHSSKNHMESLTLPNVHSNNRTTNTIYNANLTQALHNPSNYTNSNNNSSQNNNTSDAIITVDPNLDFIKTKDLDTVSIASSMHFTMVNGEAGAKKQKRGLCDRGRQVTVLIVSMSTIFLLLIMGMVYALEMRARDMPQS